MFAVTPKKSLGQHFLNDRNIAQKIANSLTWKGYDSALEIGPGTGALTEWLLLLHEKNFRFLDIDQASVNFLRSRFPENAERIEEGNVLDMPLDKLFPGPFAIIGNFPYNISSQIFFKILEAKQQIKEVVCMIQKEVALRIASGPGSKAYGILSVFLQAYFDIEYLFTVPPQVFTPPPKVHSAVIRLHRNQTDTLACPEELFYKVVKTAFNQRRKILRNSLKNLTFPLDTTGLVWLKRPEQLSIHDFIALSSSLQNSSNKLTHGI